MAERIGFIGLGNIGRPMAANTLARSKALTVFDLNADRVRTLTDAGAVAAKSVGDVAAASDIILLSLPTSAEVETVLLGKDGVASKAAKNTLVIDLTSGSPPRSKDIAARLAERGIHYIDAGVSGGVAGAEA